LVSRYATIFQSNDALRDWQYPRVVRHDRYNALIVARDISQQLRDLRSVCGIEAGRRLVGEHHDRSMCDSTCNSDALFFAVRHLVWPQMRLRGQPDHVQRGQGAAAPCGAALSRAKGGYFPRH
jgi:hypothetical protein